MSEKNSGSSDASYFLNSTSSNTRNRVFNLPKLPFDEDVKITKDSNNFER